MKPYRGLALVGVLWLTAALAILVVGLVHSVRGEIRSVSAEQSMVLADAAGDAAIQLVLQRLTSASRRPEKLASVEVVFEGAAVVVEVQPFAGLIDINKAPHALLAQAAVVLASLQPKDADAFASAVVTFREAARESSVIAAQPGFNAIEELLNVPGVSFDLWSLLSPWMVIDARAVGGVNPMAAPLPVLRVLAGGREDIAMGIDAKRTAADVAIDTTQLDPSFLSTTTSDRVRMTAFVNMPDGGVMKVIRAVRLGHSQGHGLSWRVFDARRELRLSMLDSPALLPQS